LSSKRIGVTSLTFECNLLKLMRF